MFGRNIINNTEEQIIHLYISRVVKNIRIGPNEILSKWSKIGYCYGKEVYLFRLY